jgi:uncharacterized protein
VKNKGSLIVSIIMIVSLVALAGCTAVRAETSSPTSTAPISVNVNSQQGIWVNGEGKVTVTPDIAVVSLGVSAQAPKVTDAQAQAAEAMAKVIAVLTSNGIEKKDIQTQNYNITPLYDYTKTGFAISQGTEVAPGMPSTVIAPPAIPPSPTNPTIRGYQVDNMVVAKIRSVDKAGSIIDAVAAAGGDLTRISSIYFSVDQPEKYYPQARTAAMNDAKAKAENLASLAGVKLGSATYISESSYSMPIRYPEAMYKSMDSAAGSMPTTSINPGETDVTLSVQVDYSIQ